MELQGIQLPDYLVIMAYFTIIILIGIYSKRYIKKAKDYFAAGNVMPWWLAGTSFYMASFSALLFVIYSEICYNYGIVGIVITWITPVCVLLGGYFTAHLWRRARVVTPLGFMERRYSSAVHQLFVWTGIPLRMFDNALKIFSTAIVMAVSIRGSGISISEFMVIIGVIMIVYSFLGGQMTVIITDFIQATILLVAVIFLFILTYQLVIDDLGSFGAFVSQLPDDFLKPVREPYDLSYLIFTVFLLIILNYNASWSLVQKYNTVRSEKDARKMVYLITFLTFITPPIFFFPAIAAKILIPNIENAKEVYAAISLKVLPIGSMGFMLAALLSATMSTLASEFNTLSGILTRDFYKKKINPNIDEEKEVVYGRIATVVVGTVTISLAILLSFLKGLTLMDIMFRFFTAFGPPIMIPLIFGLLIKKFNARGVVWGVIIGATVGVILILVNFVMISIYAEEMKLDTNLDFWLRSGWNSVATVVNIISTILGMWFGTVTRSTPKEEEEKVKEFFDNLKKPFISEVETKSSSSLSPFKIIGISLVAFGITIILIALFILLSYNNLSAFWVNLNISFTISIIGGIMWLRFK